MIGGGLALCCAGLMQSAPVFLEWKAPEAPVYREQAVTLSLHLGAEQGFLAEAMVQPFSRELDFPVQLETTLDPQQWRRRARSDPSDGALPSLVLDGAIVRADRLREEIRDGRSYWVAELDLTLVPLAAAPALAAKAAARYSWTAERGSDLFGDPVAGDRQDAALAAESQGVRVLDWPEAASPAGFRGAVGEFHFSATKLPGGGEDLLRIRFEIAGEGNWESLEPPALDAVAGFHLLGRLVERAPQRVTVTADFALDPESPAVFPPVEFSFLDPQQAGYRSVHTSDIPVRAENAPQPADPPHAPPDLGGCEDPRLRAQLFGLAAATAGFWSLCGVLWLRRRARSRSAAAARADLAVAPASDPASALSAFLARELGVNESRLHAPDLGALLRMHGVAEPLARDAAGLFEALQAERYGGPAVAEAERRWTEVRARWRSARPGVDPLH